MIYTQKGCLQSVVNSFAAFLFIVISVTSTLSFSQALWDLPLKLTPLENITLLLSAFLNSYALLLIVLPVILLLTWAFPSIRISKNGLRYYSFFGSKWIRWNEIDDIVDLKWPHNYKAVVINRKGFVIFNGLWVNFVYGAFLGIPDPLILLSENINGRVELLDAIEKGSASASDR